jgi:hypothetical protein
MQIFLGLCFQIFHCQFHNILQAAFHTKVLSAPFMCLQFGFVIFWWKDFGSKAAHKMLVKLTPGVNATKKIFFVANE